MTEHYINLSEIPEITEEQMKRATLRVGGEPIAQGKVTKSTSWILEDIDD